MSDIASHIPDPRTMAPDDLRTAMRETYSGMAKAWVLMAAGFRRIQSDRLYEAWGLGSWNAYLASDLPTLDDRTVQRMVQGLNYLESTERDQVDGILNGGSGGSGATPLDYNAACRLDSLRFKVEEGAVPRDEWLAVHRAAICGEISGRETRRRVGLLSKGLRLTPPPATDPDEQRVRPLVNRIALVTSELRSLKRMAEDGRIPEGQGRLLVLGLGDLMRSVIEAFGEKRLDALVTKAKAQHNEREEQRAKRPKLARRA